MTGICGWCGPAMGEAAGTDALVRMFSGFPALPGVSEHRHAATSGGLAIQHQKDAGSFFRDGPYISALAGYPLWHEPRYRDIAVSRGHSAALAAAYRAEGADFLQKLGGHFVCAVIDAERRSALIAVDRAGVEGLNYAELPDGRVVFGSSADCVAFFPGADARISLQGIYDYLFSSFGVYAPDSIYVNQAKLLPGEYLHYENGKLKRERYWQIDYSHPSDAGFDELCAELRTRMRAAVARVVDDEKGAQIGSFLSGGLDSSTVAGLFAECSEAARSFTIGFDIPRFDETEYARLAATHFDLDYHEYKPTPEDVAQLIPEIARVYDEPFGNSSAVAVYCCARLAREHGIDIMLAGDGGDEIFAGNERYLEAERIEKYADLPGWLRKGVLEGILFKLPGIAHLPVVGKAFRWHQHYQMPPSGRVYRHAYFPNIPVEQIVSQDKAAAINPQRVLEKSCQRYAALDTGDLVQRLMYVDQHFTLADNDLRKVNRMCHLSGVRVRYPMLDDDLIAFSSRIPAHYLMADGELRHFFKHAMKDVLPSRIIAKSKHGFGLPFQNWAKHDAVLKTMIDDNLAAFRERGLLEPRFVEEIRASHHATEISARDGVAWDIMMLEMWLQRHVDGKARAIAA